MHFTAAVISSLAVLASASPFAPFPLSNGFPKLSPKALATVEKHAGGTLPNTPLPKKLSKTAAAVFQLVSAQETFEVAYFNNLLHNITMKKPGYELPKAEYDEIHAALYRIRAQEQLHAYGANAILATAGEKVPKFCEYMFPVNNFKDAIVLANTFTDVVIGVLPTAQELFALDGGDETGLILLVGAIIGQESEQNGYYRALSKKKPSAAPFLTGGAAQFAYSALSMFIVPGSCPEVEHLPIPKFTPITVLNAPGYATDTTVQMAIEKGKVDSKMMSVTYLSGQNLPVTVPIKKATMKGDYAIVEAELPFVSKGFAKGLSIAAITKGHRHYASAAEVADNAVYGPGLIEVL